jgi:sulfonate transport system permease protein
MGWSKTFNNLIDLPFNFFRAIPIAAMIPVFMVWFGLGEFPKILAITLSPLTKLAINTHAGVKSVDAIYIKAARVLGAKDRDIFKEVVIPSSLPMIFAGLRVTAVMSFVLLIVVEMVGASSGLGFFIKNSEEFLRTDDMFAGIFVLAVLALILDGIIRITEKKCLAWQAHGKSPVRLNIERRG